IFAMRVWLDPDRMRAYSVSTDDVMKALSEQSVIGSPGRLGQATGILSQSKEYVLTYIGRYNKPEQYENIILRANSDGEILRLKDICLPPQEEPTSAGGEHSAGAGGKNPPPRAEVGRGEKAHGKKQRRGVELGSEFFDIYSDINGHPAASIVLKQAPGSNAAVVIEEVKRELEQIKKEKFPPGMDYELAYDV